MSDRYYTSYLYRVRLTILFESKAWVCWIGRGSDGWYESVHGRTKFGTLCKAKKWIKEMESK